MLLAKDLRRAILQSAMQGKITEQLSTDGSIDELIKYFNEQNGNIKQKDIFPPICDDEIPFDIPDTWRWVRMIDVVKSISAGGDKPSKFSKEKSAEYTVPVIANGETNKGILGYADKPVVTEESLTVSGRGTIGYSVVRTDPYVPIVRLLVLLPYEKTNLYYLQYVLKAFIETGVGTAVKQLTVPMLKPKVIPLPPIEEQERIVKKLDIIMQEIDKYEQIEKYLDNIQKKFPMDMKNSVLQYAFQGKLTKQQKEDSSIDEWLLQISDEIKAFKWKAKKVIDIEDILDILGNPDIPDTWRWVRLSDIAVSNIGLTYKPENITSDGTIVLRSSNIQNGKMDYNDIVRVNMDIPENKMCNIGDILMCSRNGSKALVGKVAIIDNVGMSFGAFMAIIRSRCNKYLYYFFNSQLFKKQMNPNSSTETINQITQDMLFNCIIPLPPIEEQERIVKKLEQILPLIDDLEE